MDGANFLSFEMQAPSPPKFYPGLSPCIGVGQLVDFVFIERNEYCRFRYTSAFI